MTQCDWSSWCAEGSAVLAFAAALSWLYSASVSRGAFWRKPLVGDGNLFSRVSARWNCIAAFLAGLAALLQAYVTAVLPVCASLLDLRH